MRLPLVSTAILLAFGTATFAQSDFGLKADGGIGCITASNGPDAEPVSHTTSFLPTYQWGVYYNLHFGTKFTFGTELLYGQLNGKENMITSVPSPFGNFLPLYNADNLTEKVSYLGIPIYFEFMFNKFGISFGFQGNVTIAASGEDVGQAYQIANHTDATWDNKAARSSFGSFTYGIRAGLSYNVCNNLTIDATYYLGPMFITYPSQSGWFEQSELQNWKAQQLTLGLCYTLVSFGKKDENK